MPLQIGIIGLPNVGKSTLFKALTKKSVDIANYPFCTIDPNVGVVKVPDERLKKLAAVSKSKEIIPTVIEFVDIAGLVAGAHKGEGLGNKFLAHIREVDAICQVVRDFTDPNVTHVEGRINPKSDTETINLELIFADLETVKKRLETLQRETKSGIDKTLKKKIEIVKKIKVGLEEGQMANSLGFGEEEKILVKDLCLLTLKPMLYVLNIDEGLLAGPRAGKKETCDIARLDDCLEISAKLEAELAELSEVETRQYLADLNIAETGLEKLIKACYELLDLITFFTSGEKETRAWTVKRGAKAPQAAGKIHTDFERGFIKAEVINWKDLIEAGGEIAAKEKGLVRLEGKDYIVQDGDVMVFKFAA